MHAWLVLQNGELDQALCSLHDIAVTHAYRRNVDPPWMPGLPRPSLGAPAGHPQEAGGRTSHLPEG